MKAVNIFGRSLGAACAVVFLAALAQVHAATLTVTNTNNDGPGSLRDAVRNSASGDTIVCNVTGNISLTGGEIAIGHNLSILGPATGRLAVMGGYGRAFSVTGGTVAISNLALSGNILAGIGGNADGGALYNQGTLTLTEVSIWGSFASGGQGPSSEGPAAAGGSGRGGGVANYGTLTLLRCAISGTRAIGGMGGYSNGSSAGIGGTAIGGGVYNAGTLSLINTTVDACVASGGNGGESSYGAGNGGVGAGGAIYNAGTFTTTNCTISTSSASGGSGGTGAGAGAGIGGGVYQQNDSGVTSLRNTIVALNGASSGNGTDAAGYFNSQGHNLIGRTDGTAGWNATDLLGGTSDAARLDPRLGLLQDNGGATISRLPFADSPALNAGDDAVLTPPISLGDQRELPRKVGAHIDIGSVERGGAQSGSRFTVTTLDEHDDGTCTSDECSLLEAIRAANANPDATIIDFAPGLSGAIGTSSTPQGLPLHTPMTIIGPSALAVSLGASGQGRVLDVASNVTVSGLTIRDGRVSFEDGGGIHNRGNLTLSDCSIFANKTASSPHGGGGIYNAPNATLNLVRCAVENNFTDRPGGGIYNEGALVATNCTFGQQFAINGGAIFSHPANAAGGMTLRNCTITTSTSAGGEGGAVYVDGDPQVHHVGNSIIAGNTTFGSNPDVRGIFTSDGHNFIGNAGYSVGFVEGLNGDQVGNVVLPKDPLLAPRTNNGGTTNTSALQPGSPAINAGDDSLAPPTDQRSYSRSGPSDIGAFELNGAPASVSPPRITFLARAQGGGMTVGGSAAPNATVNLEVSGDPNPASFVFLVSVTSDANGLWSYTDQGAAGMQRRLYRVTQ